MRENEGKKESSAYEIITLRVYANFGQIESVSHTTRWSCEFIVRNLLNGFVYIYNALIAKPFFIEDKHKER